MAVSHFVGLQVGCWWPCLLPRPNREASFKSTVQMLSSMSENNMPYRHEFVIYLGTFWRIQIYKYGSKRVREGGDSDPSLWNCVFPTVSSQSPPCPAHPAFFQQFVTVRPSVLAPRNHILSVLFLSWESSCCSTGRAGMGTQVAPEYRCHPQPNSS